MAVEEQVVVIFAGTNGYLDDIPVADVKRFEIELLEYLRTRHSNILDTIRTSGALPDGDTLADSVQTFKELFEPSAEVTTTDEDEDKG
jgi:F-type H+-transporting ATPase subunit alpha